MTFEADLVAQLTVLRCYAHKLTRDREEAMDLVQETCERALRFRHFFHEGTNLRAWVLSIMRHHFLDRAKRRRDAMASGHSVPLDELSEGAHYAPRAEQICFMKEALGFAKESLSEEQASIFWPTLEGATEAECMALRGVSRSTVATRLHRARCFLRRACAA
jgi:RNA polymerase sigma-70 factor (ECF subfamily)